MISNRKTQSKNKIVATWLFICCVMIFSMVIIGGITRLTESGLSMTSWKPATFLPPLSLEQWQQEFSSYKQSPEYIKKNFGMNLDEFKGIFWLEFIHRLLGRITGLMFIIPMLFFAFKGYLNRPLIFKLSGVFIFGGLQGIVGWYMVKSGLKDAPYVSHLWLAFHLSCALVIFSSVFLLALGRIKECAENSVIVPAKFKNLAIAMLFVTFVQIVLGAFVAGLDGGLIYNTFPDMNGQMLPDGIMHMQPWYMNFIENITMIQFCHRANAYILLALVIIFWAVSGKNSFTKRFNYARHALLVIICIQFLLGVLTLLKEVPVSLASMHQGFAFVLFAIMIYVTHEIFAPSCKSGDTV